MKIIHRSTGRKISIDDLEKLLSCIYPDYRIAISSIIDYLKKGTFKINSSSFMEFVDSIWGLQGFHMSMIHDYINIKFENHSDRNLIYMIGSPKVEFINNIDSDVVIRFLNGKSIYIVKPIYAFHYNVFTYLNNKKFLYPFEELTYHRKQYISVNKTKDLQTIINKVNEYIP